MGTAVGDKGRGQTSATPAVKHGGCGGGGGGGGGDGGCGGGASPKRTCRHREAFGPPDWSSWLATARTAVKALSPPNSSPPHTHIEREVARDRRGERENTTTLP